MIIVFHLLHIPFRAWLLSSISALRSSPRALEVYVLQRVLLPQLAGTHLRALHLADIGAEFRRSGYTWVEQTRLIINNFAIITQYISIVSHNLCRIACLVWYVTKPTNPHTNPSCSFPFANTKLKSYLW